MYLQELKLNKEEIARLRGADKNLLRLKKLYLVLDLDHTLLNSTQLFDLHPDEVYLMGQTDSLEGKLCYTMLFCFCFC